MAENVATSRPRPPTHLHGWPGYPCACSIVAETDDAEEAD